MPYLMGGFPDAETAAAVADAYADAGADLIELGVPFSDPLADGPVIHAAATKALRGGATLDSVLEAGAAMAARLPAVPMVYANMVLARGPEASRTTWPSRGSRARSSRTCRPRRPTRPARALRAAGLALVPLVAPTTPPERRAEICAAATGFVYLVSDTRTTGERETLPSRTRRADRGHEGRFERAGGGRVRHRNS